MYQLLSDRSIIEVSGEEALPFLQNLTTNDLGQYDYCYSYMISNQGRYLFDFFILKNTGEKKFWLDIHSEQAKSVQSKLLMYKLHAKVHVQEVTANYKIIYSRQMPTSLPVIAAYHDPRFSLLGCRSILNRDYALDSQGGLYLHDKYKYAIIDGYEDLVTNKSIPIEYGAEQLNSLSFTKGCYLGQEVMARAKHQGVIRKKIFTLQAQADLNSCSKGDAVMLEEQLIGTLCSSYQNQAIAIIKTDKLLVSEQKQATINNIKVELFPAPWWKN